MGSGLASILKRTVIRKLQLMKQQLRLADTAQDSVYLSLLLDMPNRPILESGVMVVKMFHMEGQQSDNGCSFTK